MNFNFYIIYYIAMLFLVSVFLVASFIMIKFQKVIKKDRENIIKSLESIDLSLLMLKKCVKESDRTWGEQTYFITGNWNDRKY